MTDKPTIDDEIKHIDQTLHAYDILDVARDKALELNNLDQTLKGITLHFESRTLGDISVPVHVSY